MPKKPKARRKKKEPLHFGGAQIDGPFAQQLLELLQKASEDLFRKHCANLIPMYVVDFLILQIKAKGATTRVEVQESLEKLLQGFLDPNQVEELMVIGMDLHTAAVTREETGEDSSPLFEQAGEEVYRLIPPEHLHPVMDLLDHARKGLLVGNA